MCVLGIVQQQCGTDRQSRQRTEGKENMYNYKIRQKGREGSRQERRDTEAKSNDK